MFSHTLAQYDTAGRLLQLLVHYKDVFGRELVAGKSYEIDLSLTQADLASMVGAQREWVNRLLRKWREKGLIEYQRGKIKLIDLEAVVAEKNRRIAAFDNDMWVIAATKQLEKSMRIFTTRQRNRSKRGKKCLSVTKNS